MGEESEYIMKDMGKDDSNKNLDWTSSGKSGVMVGYGDKKPHNENKPHDSYVLQVDDEYKTSTVLPEADLREAEGEVNRRGTTPSGTDAVTSSGKALCKTTSVGGEWNNECYMTDDFRELLYKVDNVGYIDMVKRVLINESSERCYDIVLSLFNIYSMEFDGIFKNLLERRVIIERLLELFDEYFNDLIILSYDHSNLMGITIPHDNKLKIFIKFNPKPFIPIQSLQPKCYPQSIINLNNNSQIAIPNITLIINTILKFTNGILDNINFLN